MTNREDEVLALVIEGKRSPAIASALSLSYYTVDHYLKRLRARYGVATTLELVVTVLTQQRDEARERLEHCRKDLAALDRRGRT